MPDVTKFCQIFRDGHFCTRPGGVYGYQRGCYSKLNDIRRSRYALCWEKNRILITSHYFGAEATERPDRFFNSDAGGYEQLVSAPEAGYDAG